MLAGRTIKVLIDTGASKNYIKSLNELKAIEKTKNPFTVHSIHGHNVIREKWIVNLFGRNTYFYTLLREGILVLSIRL